MPWLDESEWLLHQRVTTNPRRCGAVLFYCSQPPDFSAQIATREFEYPIIRSIFGGFNATAKHISFPFLGFTETSSSRVARCCVCDHFAARLPSFKSLDFLFDLCRDHFTGAVLYTATAYFWFTTNYRSTILRFFFALWIDILIGSCCISQLRFV